MSTELLTVEEAAKFLKTTPYTVRKWLRNGQLKGSKIGREWRIPQSQLPT